MSVSTKHTNLVKEDDELYSAIALRKSRHIPAGRVDDIVNNIARKIISYYKLSAVEKENHFLQEIEGDVSRTKHILSYLPSQLICEMFKCRTSNFSERYTPSRWTLAHVAAYLGFKALFPMLFKRMVQLNIPPEQ